MQREFGGRIFDHISSIVHMGSDGAISTYTPHHRHEGRSAIPSASTAQVRFYSTGGLLDLRYEDAEISRFRSGTIPEM